MTKIRRKLYSRGSSYETTIPMPILFDSNLKSKQDVVFEYDKTQDRWYLQIVERGKEPKKKLSKLSVNKDLREQLRRELEKNIKELLQEQMK